MNITVAWQNGSTTKHSNLFAQQSPFAREGNAIISECIIRYDLLYDEGLRIDVFYPDAQPGMQTKTVTHDLTHAPIRECVRQSGRIVRILSLQELNDIRYVEIDGRVVILNTDGIIVNMNNYLQEAVYQAAVADYHERISEEMFNKDEDDESDSDDEDDYSQYPNSLFMN